MEHEENHIELNRLNTKNNVFWQNMFRLSIVCRLLVNLYPIVCFCLHYNALARHRPALPVHTIGLEEDTKIIKLIGSMKRQCVFDMCRAA